MYKNLDLPAVLFILFTLKQAVAMESTISITCRGDHQYLDQNGDCQQCEMCPAGHQPVNYCGYGERHINYGCQICPVGTFSLRSDYNVCVQCRPCEDWNAEIVQTCSPDSNQVCGTCYEGYYRPYKSDGALTDECHPCTAAPRGTAQCEKKPDLKWRNIAYIMIGVAGLFILLLMVTCGVWLQGRSRRRKKKADSMRSDSSSDVANDPVTAETRESLLQSSGSNRNSQSSEDSRFDGEHSIQIEQEVPSPKIISRLVVRSPKSVPASYLSETVRLKNAATRQRSMPPSSTGNHVSDSGYSNMPTAEYVESHCSHDSQSPSNLSTGRYDDLHPSQTHAIRVSSRSRGRPQGAGVSSSSENLIPNMDRDSREVGGSQTPVNTDVFDVESFDTSSVTGETKPHKIFPVG